MIEVGSHRKSLLVGRIDQSLDLIKLGLSNLYLLVFVIWRIVQVVAEIPLVILLTVVQ